jgi:hypothetical protein
MMFQSYALWPHLTVARNVAFGLEERRVRTAEIARAQALDSEDKARSVIEDQSTFRRTTTALLWRALVFVRDIFCRMNRSRSPTPNCGSRNARRNPEGLRSRWTPFMCRTTKGCHRYGSSGHGRGDTHGVHLQTSRSNIMPEFMIK